MTVVAVAKDRRQSPTNRERRAAAHALLDRAFDTAAQQDDNYQRISIEAEFHHGTSQRVIAYCSGNRIE